MFTLMQTSSLQEAGGEGQFYSTKAKTLEDCKATAVLWLGWGRRRKRRSERPIRDCGIRDCSVCSANVRS